jgi:bacterioferritin-associated ferredoxin
MVNRCVCHKRTFEELLELAKVNKVTTLGEMIDRGWCGTNCGLCHMYVENMLKSGETQFNHSDIKRNNAS